MSKSTAMLPSLLCLSIGICIIGLVQSFPPMGYHPYRSHYRTNERHRPGMYNGGGRGGGSGGGSNYPRHSSSHDNHYRHSHRSSKPDRPHHSDDYHRDPHDSDRYHHHGQHNQHNHAHNDDSVYHRKNKMSYYGDQSMKDSNDHYHYDHHNQPDNDYPYHQDDYGNSFENHHPGNNKRTHDKPGNRHRYPINPPVRPDNQDEEGQQQSEAANANNPDFYTIESQESPITILFKTSSIPLNVQQESVVSSSVPVQRLISQEPPHQLIHRVTKPIVQEIHEIIAPYRKVTQEIRPVQEEFQTIVASDNASNSGNQMNGGAGGRRNLGQNPSQNPNSFNKNARRLFDIAMQMNGSNQPGAFLVSSISNAKNHQPSSSLSRPNSLMAMSQSQISASSRQQAENNNNSNSSNGGSSSGEISNSINPSSPSSSAK